MPARLFRPDRRRGTHLRMLHERSRAPAWGAPTPRIPPARSPAPAAQAPPEAPAEAARKAAFTVVGVKGGRDDAPPADAA